MCEMINILLNERKRLINFLPTLSDKDNYELKVKCRIQIEFISKFTREYLILKSK